MTLVDGRGATKYLCMKNEKVPILSKYFEPHDRDLGHDLFVPCSPYPRETREPRGFRVNHGPLKVSDPRRCVDVWVMPRVSHAMRVVYVRLMPQLSARTK